MSDNLSDTWMWERARNLIDQAEKLQKQFAQPGGSAKGSVGWTPPVDVFETKNELWVLIALPGTQPADITVSFDGLRLTVSGTRNLPEPFRRAIIHRMEIPNGRFERSVHLPVECKEVTRNQFTHGCLLIGLRKV
ncbi:MAG: Hsp20/alpha crystallin family protein [Planctomycetota bacterium]|nr:Hsp20/alpha crystallin family protein [Planctomycetota bacterium]